MGSVIGGKSASDPKGTVPLEGKMANRLPARRIAYERPLTGALIHRTMSSLFPRRNDYGGGSFDELVPELEALGISSAGDFKRLMTRYRRALLDFDRAPLFEF